VSARRDHLEYVPDLARPLGSCTTSAPAGDQSAVATVARGRSRPAP
jgi:hypothetical protein